MARALKYAISRYRLFPLLILLSLTLYLAHAQAEELEGFEDGVEIGGVKMNNLNMLMIPHFYAAAAKNLWISYAVSKK